MVAHASEVNHCGFLRALSSFFSLFKTTEGQHLQLSDDVTVIQLSTSCHNIRMTTRVITFSRVDVISLTTNVLTIRLFIKIIPIWLAIKVI